MFSLLVTLITPNAEACSPAPAEPVWSFPADGSSDSALNQLLQIFVMNANYGGIEITVWNGETDESIEGYAYHSCTADPNGWDSCLVSYLPESGFWPSESEILWSAAPTPGEGWAETLSGSFSTTDWLSVGELPEAMNIEGEMVEWRPIQSECDSGPSIQVSISIEPDSLNELEKGAILQVMQEQPENLDGTLPEPLVVAQHLVQTDGNIELNFDILATEYESCFNVWAYSPDGTNFSQYDGPCLKWGQADGGNGGGWGCSAAPDSSSLHLGWMSAMLMLMLGRRREG